jgi:hypothetical protein
MTVDIDVPPKKGEIMRIDGRVRMIRVHEHGTGYGASAHRLNEDCIITLDTEPGAAFGLELSGANMWAGRSMFNLLRTAFASDRLVTIEYEATSAIGGRVLRVVNTR